MINHVFTSFLALVTLFPSCLHLKAIGKLNLSPIRSNLYLTSDFGRLTTENVFLQVKVRHYLLAIGGYVKYHVFGLRTVRKIYHMEQNHGYEFRNLKKIRAKKTPIRLQRDLKP